MPGANLFKLLREVVERPGLWGFFEEIPLESRMYGLRALLWGYEACAKNSPVEDDTSRTFHRKFSEFLRRTKGWSLSQGPEFAILNLHGDRAWEVFFELAFEFERELTAGRES